MTLHTELCDQAFVLAMSRERLLQAFHGESCEQDDSGLPLPAEDDARLTLAEIEQRHITRVLREERGRVEAAALRLDVPRSTLYEKIRRYGIVIAKS